MMVRDRHFQYILDLTNKMLEKSATRHNIKVFMGRLHKENILTIPDNIPKSKILESLKRGKIVQRFAFNFLIYFCSVFFFFLLCYCFEWFFLNI